MSFFNTVEVDRDELNRLERLAREAENLRERLRRERKSRGKVENRVKKMERNFSKRIDNLRKLNEELDKEVRILNEELTSHKIKFKNLDEKIDLVKEDLDREIQSLRKETNLKIKKINNELKEIRLEKENKKELALSWLKNFENVIKMIKELEHEKFKPGELNKLLEEARLAKKNINNGVFEAAISSLQERFLDARELFNEVFLLQQEFEELKTIALNNIDELNDLLKAQKEVEFIIFDENVKVDVNYWTNGKLERIKSEIEQLKEKIENPKTTTEELVEIIARENVLFEELKNIAEEAKNNILLSESRIDLAENVEDVLEDLGYDLVGATFEKDDKRKSAVLKFENEGGEEIITVLTPRGNKNSLNIIFGLENTNLAMKDMRLHSILNKLKERGIELNNFKCVDSEVPADYKIPDDIEKVKSGEVEVKSL